MQLIYMQRTIHLMLSSGVQLPKEHILNNDIEPEVRDINGERYLVFQINEN